MTLMFPIWSWAAEALCAQADPELWFPDRGESNKVAKSVCRQCPVKEQCLQEALMTPDYGIWGGTSEAERAQMRRELGIKLPSGHIRHGTEAGARQHYRKGERPCSECMEAQLRYGQDRRRKRVPA